MALRWVVLLALVALGESQRYVDYDYESEPSPPPRPRPRQPAPPPPKSSPSATRVTPVPILKQINRHNEDGSYTYGYEAADGSFKIETKNANGDVKGKYGFVDDGGMLRTVDYGADRYGFQPSGEGITVPPPTIVDETATEDYYRPARPAARPAYRQQQQVVEAVPVYQEVPVYRPQPQEVPVYRPQPRPAPAPRPIVHVPQPQFSEPPTRAQFAPAPAPRPLSGFRPGPSASAFVPAPRPAPRPAPPQFANAIPISAPIAPRSPPPPQQSFPVARAAPPQSSRGPGGFLDQLARDYALPSDTAPALHDISFGYY